MKNEEKRAEGIELKAKGIEPGARSQKLKIEDEDEKIEIAEL